MAERHNRRQGRQEGPVLILWMTGAKGSFWAGWRTHTQRCCELAARMICLELSSVGLRLQSTVGSPGSLMQVQIPKPIPTSDPAAVVEAEGQPAFSHFSNRNPVPLLLSLCSPGRTDARLLRPLVPRHGHTAPAWPVNLTGWFREESACDQSLANQHQPWAFCWNVRDTLFPLLSRGDSNCEAGIHNQCVSLFLRLLCAPPSTLAATP